MIKWRKNGAAWSAPAINDQVATDTKLTPAQQEARALAAHPEVGGAHLEATRAHANRALDRFLPVNTPEGQQFRAAMEKNGLSDWVPLVALLARAGKAMGEDPLLSPKPATALANARQEADAQADRFYPSMAKAK